MNNDKRNLVSTSVFLGGFLLTEWLGLTRRSHLGARLLPGAVAGVICWIAYPYLAAKMISSDK